MTFVELLLHPGKYEVLPALEETGKLASKLGVADKLPAQLASRVKGAVEELKAKAKATAAPSNPSVTDGKDHVKENKKEKTKKEKKHKRDKEGSTKEAKKAKK